MNNGLAFYKKEKFKQNFLIITAFALIVFGYLNFNLNSKETSLEVSSRANEVNLGDVELVNSEPVSIDNSVSTNGIVPNDEIGNTINNSNNSKSIDENTINEKNINTVNINNNIIDNNLVKNYFEETKIERNRMYSEIQETYQKMIDSQNISEDQKAIAMQEISNITKIKNGIMISENLIKNKGFDDVVILVNNGKVNVVLKNAMLSQEQISQIQNIIEKQFNVKIQDINISFKQ